MGVPGPVHAQLEEAGRPGGGKLHRNNLSLGEQGTDPSSAQEAARGMQGGRETWAVPRVSGHRQIKLHCTQFPQNNHHPKILRLKG